MRLQHHDSHLDLAERGTNNCSDPDPADTHFQDRGDTRLLSRNLAGGHQGHRHTMTATVEGLTPNSRHVIMIHAGTCARVEDTHYVPVDHVNADAKGTLTSVTTWPGLFTVPADGRIYCLHRDDRSIYEITDTACAEMTV